MKTNLNENDVLDPAGAVEESVEIVLSRLGRQAPHEDLHFRSKQKILKKSFFFTN